MERGGETRGGITYIHVYADEYSFTSVRIEVKNTLALCNKWLIDYVHARDQFWDSITSRIALVLALHMRVRLRSSNHCIYMQ